MTFAVGMPAIKDTRYRSVEIKPSDGDLADLLIIEIQKAKSLNLTPFVQFYADWCKPCRLLRSSMTDPLMIDAFKGTYIIKLNADSCDKKLRGTGFHPGTIPVFYSIDENGWPTGKSINGGAWGENIPKNMAPPLKQFFSQNAWVQTTQLGTKHKNVWGAFSGEWDKNKADSIAKNIFENSGRFDDYAHYQIENPILFTHKGRQKYFIQVSMAGEGCHFCPGYIGAIIFSQRNGAWEVESINEDFAALGCWGFPPQPQAIKLGADRYGLLYEWDRDAQGGGGLVHYYVIINLWTKKYDLILEEEKYSKSEESKPTFPVVKVLSVSDSAVNDIQIGTSIYKYTDGRYQKL